jgi:CMD domain protein
MTMLPSPARRVAAHNHQQREDRAAPTMTTIPASTTPPYAVTDVIDHMAGVTAGSAAARARAQRPDVVRHAQGSYDALLAPPDPAGLSLIERAQVALRVALLTPSAPGVAWYRARLTDLGAAATATVIEHFPQGPAVSPRLAALLHHADRLTTAPSSATPAHLRALEAAGLDPATIVTLAQLIAFVSFQVRVVAGLRALMEAT